MASVQQDHEVTAFAFLISHGNLWLANSKHQADYDFATWD
ncbi:hypothetical protein BGLA2_220008 [Burkholderia gladioli]|nr:hypothetical protein BGLA2_220008 [Burkholderia gladioli]